MVPSVRVDDALAPQLAACSDRLAARLGLHFPRERWSELQRAVGAAASELGCGGVRDCLAWLATAALTPSQLDILARHLTVGETYFFRQPAAFAALRDRILPELVEARDGDPARRIRIWSAGCSTGEEPYSIAITVAEALPDLRRWNLTVLGTDVNPVALAKAREAVYSAWSFRGAEPGFQERYFSPNGDGRYRLAPRVRALVTLAPLNLVDGRYPAVETNTNAMDVIFCRNVLMYFHPERARAVVERLTRSLADGGCLVVSPVESSLLASSSLQPYRQAGLIVYRKTEKGAARTISAADAWGDRSATQNGEPPARRQSSLPRPAAGDAALADATALHGEGRYEEAVAVLEALLAGQPGRADVLLLLARAQANRGRLAEALARCDEAVAAARLDPAASYLRASVLLELGQQEAAAAAFKRTLYLDPECPLAHFGLGNLRASQRRAGDAARHYRHALAILGTMPPGSVLREADGIPAGRLREMIEAILGTEGSS